MSMRVYIKGMEMPENCRRCPFAEKVPPGRTRCLITCRFLADGYNAPSPERNEFCPLVAQPELKCGKWEQVANDDNGIDFRCSVCHRYRFHNGEMLRKYRFCPNCGADMRGENNG